MTRRRPTSSEEGEWRLRAACRDADAGLFFSVEGESAPARQVRALAAKSVCARCPVIEACRTYAVNAGEPYGVWGGQTAKERRRLHQEALRSARRRADSRSRAADSPTAARGPGAPPEPRPGPGFRPRRPRVGSGP